VLLHVLLRLRPRLGRDDGDVAAGATRDLEPGGEQRALDPAAAVLRERGRPTQLGHALEQAHAGRSGQGTRPPGPVAHESFGLRHVVHHVLELVAGEGLVRGHALAVRAREAGDREVEPRGTLRDRALRHHDPLGGSRWRIDRQAAPEHVLEVHERVAAAREERAEAGFGEARELDLDGHTALGEGALDGVELTRIERAGKAEPRHLVERRARGRERGDSAGDRHRESTRPGPPPRGRGSAVSHEARVRALDPGRECGTGEEHAATDHSRKPVAASAPVV
jgi:hypothetical protein